MPTVSVPGVGGTTINLQFQTTANAALAQTLANSFWAALGGGTLNVQNELASASVSGSLNEYTIGDADGGVNNGATQGTVPAGYQGVIDAFNNHAATVTGNASVVDETVLSGQAGLTFIAGNASSGTVMAGGGNNVIGIPDESIGNGVGPWAVILDGPGIGTVPGGNNVVYGGSASVSINGGAGNNNLIILGSGTNDLVLSAGDGDVIAGSSGANYTIIEGGTGLIYGGRGSGEMAMFGANTVVAGSGNETIFAAPLSSGLYFVGSGGFTFVDFGGASTIVALAGASQATVFGTNGANDTFFSDSVSSALFVAGGGNETLNASGGAGPQAFFASSGSTTMEGGSGPSFFEFYNGAAGGRDLILNWTGRDQLDLHGYGTVAGANGLPVGTTQTTVGGNAVISLSDGTVITVQDNTNVSPSHIHLS